MLTKPIRLPLTKEGTQLPKTPPKEEPILCVVGPQLVDKVNLVTGKFKLL